MLHPFLRSEILWPIDELLSKLQAPVSVNKQHNKYNRAETKKEECLGLQYMTDKAGTTVGLYACAGLAKGQRHQLATSQCHHHCVSLHAYLRSWEIRGLLFRGVELLSGKL
jgi:hypothetical protein